MSRALVFIVGLLTAIVLAACAHRDPWAACHNAGEVGLGASVPTCTTPGCQACAATLDRAYRAAPDALRLHYMRAPAGAREAFLGFTRPTGSYAVEHCTAGLAASAHCAGYSPLCRNVLASGLRSADTSLALREQLTLAASIACPASREAIVQSLVHCDPPPRGPGCTDADCLACEAGHLAALTVVAPDASDAAHSAPLRDLIEHTPEPVARAIVENLGAPDAPADIDTVALQRGLRGWCFSLVGASATLPPFACNATMARFLQHTEYADSALAWAALVAARPDVRAQVVGALLTELARQGNVPPDVLTRLSTLPGEGTVTALTQVMAAAPTPDGVYRVLRDSLVVRGVTELPPEVRPRVTAPAAPVAPVGAPGGRTLGPVAGVVHAG